MAPLPPLQSLVKNRQRVSSDTTDFAIYEDMEDKSKQLNSWLRTTSRSMELLEKILQITEEILFLNNKKINVLCANGHRVTLAYPPQTYYLIDKLNKTL
ncbi:hypothetical protein LAZ67_5001414 [Cordylochernes scorpioides]|uniref:Uncharacterized protein n=1 Tax=Cordylochernes scorpioides TaxID=51811 RepID=A0ABY6KHG5_9ARAC|nr:hypothetical protein LAZ67_5001414 [Cordylochernes scorpioides]